MTNMQNHIEGDIENGLLLNKSESSEPSKHLSILDYERKWIANNRSVLMQLQDSKLSSEFCEFLHLSKSPVAILIILMMYAAYLIPRIIVQAYHEANDRHIPCLFELFQYLVLLVILLGGWVYASYHFGWTWLDRHARFLLKVTRSENWLDFSKVLQGVLYISLVLMTALALIRRVSEGECNSRSVSLFGDWDCNPNAAVKTVPADSAMLLMVLPVILTAIMREARPLVTPLAYFIAFLALFISACLLNSREPFFITVYYLIFSCVILYDTIKQYLLFYLLSREFQLTMEENERLNKQSKATEMRNMIANVAHDLKTPLSSFMHGIRMISTDIKQCEEELQKEGSTRSTDTRSRPNHVSKNYLNNFLQGMKNYLSDIDDTNAFMLMTINRCLDYTKASHGLKLVPKNETIQLTDTLLMPLNCMRNIQQAVKITLLPMDNICSHIMTDKQWLQENILCLLSNAVKYSAGGDVSIQVSLLSKTEKVALRQNNGTSVKVPCRVEDESIVVDGVSTVTPRGKAKLGEETSTTLSTKWVRNNFLKKQMTILEEQHINAEIITPRKNLPPKAQKNNKIVPINTNEFFNAEVPPLTASTVNTNTMTFDGSSHSHVSKHPEQELKADDEHKNENNNNVLRQSFSSVSSDNGSEELLFEVTDSGIGMSEEAMKMLFSPFQQTQKLAGGTGLGLYSLAKRIEALKGTYGVHKRADGKQGSVFWFTIPYRPDVLASSMPLNIPSIDDQTVSDSMPRESPIPRVESDEVPQLSSLTAKKSFSILLAEDTPSIIKMTTMMLKKQKHRVKVAENGQIVLRNLYEEGNNQNGASVHYDVILMDLSMPVMDGLEATRRIRKYERENPSSRRQLIIGLSANADEETVQEAITAGVDDFLPKPLVMDIFEEMVRKHLYYSSQ